MSMNLMVKAMHAKVGNPLRKLVLIKLADNANDLGECWPSYQHIADQCEISRRSVITHVNKLEQMGFLKKKYRKGAEKPNSSNIFTLCFDGAYSSPSESPAPAGESPASSSGESPAPRTSHSIEPVKEPSLSGKPDIASKVIQHLNEKTGSKFRATKTNVKFIDARLAEGATPADLIAVINRKCLEWLDNPEMRQYLRPSTLFNAEKFNTYIGQLDSPLPAKRQAQPDHMSRHTGFNEKDYKNGLIEQEDGSYAF